MWWPFKRKKPITDGTKCGSVYAHRWKYLHQSCDARDSLKCINEDCGIEGMIIQGAANDCDYFDIRADGMFLHVGLNEDVHYVDGLGTCRICRIPEKP